MTKHWILIGLALVLIGPVSAMTADAAKFNVLETTIAAVHKAFREGSLSCLELTQTYLNRIARFDQPTGLNSILLTNDDATARAETPSEL